ncbi:unnamed protein product, partial [Symbiodinium pilosum]
MSAENIWNHLKAGDVWLCHQTVGVQRGHWWALMVESDNDMVLADAEADPKMLRIAVSHMRTICEAHPGATFFVLVSPENAEPRMHGEVYHLRGGGGPGKMHRKRPASATPLPHQAVSTPLRTIAATRTTCVECGAALQPWRALDCRVYGLHGCYAAKHMTHRCMTAFSRDFLEYHGTLQLRGCLSIHAIGFAQKEALWKDDNTHARWRHEYSAAQLYYNVLTAAEKMWSVLKPQARFQKLLEIDLEKPLGNDFVDAYTTTAIHEVVLDGHEKVSSVCYDNFPKHGGRPKADGAAKRRTNGWFMAVHPGKGLIVGLREMYHPENNAVAVQVMVEVTAEIHTVNCIVYDRMCSCLQAARSSTSLLMVKYWCIDKFHATGHGTNCPCSSLVHTRLERRLAKVNTSIAEQTFAWFRGYAGTFNTMSRETHYYVQKHNDLVMRQHIGHLNPWSKGR